jgi:hypothetical protein
LVNDIRAGELSIGAEEAFSLKNLEREAPAATLFFPPGIIADSEVDQLP